MISRAVNMATAIIVSAAVLSSCFKDLPKKQIVLQEDFNLGMGKFRVYGHQGLIDTGKIFNFNESEVLGRFNNNRIELDLDSLPSHNLLRFQFDLYIHDAWEGNLLNPATGIPDVWQMRLDYNPWYLTTFSTTAHSQSFPGNYLSNFPAHADAWAKLPGVCARTGQPDGTTLYKIDFMTGHTSSKIHIDWSDALQPFNSLCQKSWSIDNIVITASTQ